MGPQWLRPFPPVPLRPIAPEYPEFLLSGHLGEVEPYVQEGFLAELKKMKEKNLAVLLLERLVKERIQKFERTNVVNTEGTVPFVYSWWLI